MSNFQIHGNECGIIPLVKQDYLYSKNEQDANTLRLPRDTYQAELLRIEMLRYSMEHEQIVPDALIKDRRSILLCKIYILKALLENKRIYTLGISRQYHEEGLDRYNKDLFAKAFSDIRNLLISVSRS